MLTELLFLLVGWCSSIVKGACPDGTFTYGNSCYLEFNIRATWAEASIICRAYDGYLANGNEHCLEMDMGGQYHWNDNNCENRFNFICEMPTADPGIGAGGQGVIG
uniref:C-type lectin domain-containing protein n=1 Tax=Magallana gigas TaxID=29159 RepID=A0A8W8J131_MAGGI